VKSDRQVNIANIAEAQDSFAVLETSDVCQTAVMTLTPGQASGEKGNEHPQSEQVLLVLEGEVVAEVGDTRSVLGRGDVVIVPRHVAHRFTNETQSQAITFNVYSPPAY